MSRQRLEHFPDSWYWCDWCQAWHAPAYLHCKRETGEPIPEEGWCLL